MTWAMALTSPLLYWLLAAAPQGALATLPRGATLTAAAADEVELERLATRLGPARLLRLSETGSARQRVLALRALGLSGEQHPELAAYALLPLSQWLTAQSTAPREPRLLEGGADAALRLCRALGQTPELLLSDDAAQEELPRAGVQLLRLASDATLPPGVRERLLRAVLALPAHLWSTPALATLSLAGSPLREEALAGLARSGSEPAGERVLLPLLDNEDRELSLAAVLALCDRTPLPAALPARARALAQGDGLPRGERQRLLTCLRRLGTPADVELAAELAITATPHLKAHPPAAGGPGSRRRAAP